MGVEGSSESQERGRVDIGMGGGKGKEGGRETSR